MAARPIDGDEIAYRTERISRRVCRAVAEHSFQTAEALGAKVYGGPKWTVSPVYEGMLKEEMDAAAERHPEIAYEPVLIDATYAGLVSGAASEPLVIPTLNRDGDLLSDLVMPMFGSIAGAESILLSLDDDLEVAAAMAEAPHGTAPALLARTSPTRWRWCSPARPSSTTRTSAAPRAPRRPRGRSTRRRSRPRPPGSGPRTSAARPATTEVCEEIAGAGRAPSARPGRASVARR